MLVPAYPGHRYEFYVGDVFERIDGGTLTDGDVIAQGFLVDSYADIYLISLFSTPGYAVVAWAPSTSEYEPHSWFTDLFEALLDERFAWHDFDLRATQ